MNNEERLAKHKETVEKYRADFEGIKNKFKSGNSVPVERISVKREELTSAFRYWLYRLTGGPSWLTSEKEFEEWAEDPVTHWTSDLDAAWQAWSEQQEKIDLLRARVNHLEEGGL